jgi:hypothetical protein
LVEFTALLVRPLFNPGMVPLDPTPQGTTVALALLSSCPEWADRIHLAVLLAPVAVVTHVASAPLVALAKLNTDEVAGGGGLLLAAAPRGSALQLILGLYSASGVDLRIPALFLSCPPALL